jgi:hypothetical protein
MGAVVQTRHQDQLGVDLNAHAGQAAQAVQDVRGAGVAQHPPPQVGVGGVDRDVEGAQVLLLNAGPVLLRQVGQGDVTTEQEGIPVVVVLDVEGRAQSPGHLGDEAELAAVVAATDVVKSGTGEVQAQGFVVPAARPQGLLLPSLADAQGQPLLGPVELDVYEVPQRVPVDGQEFVAGAQAQPRGQTIRMDGGDETGHEE